MSLDKKRRLECLIRGFAAFAVVSACASSALASASAPGAPAKETSVRPVAESATSVSPAASAPDTRPAQSSRPNSRPDAGNTEAEEDARKDELLAPAVETRTPGTDTNLCMSWEVDMTSDPNRRQRLAMIQGSTLGVSTDGGANFTFVNVGAFLPPGFSSVGDGSASYDAAGRLFVSILGNPASGGGWDVFVSRHDPTDGSLVSGPVNVTAQVGITTSMNADKPWIAADANLTGDFANRLYVVWSLTGGGLSGDWEVWGAVSADQGTTWTQMTRNGVNYGPISPLDSSDGRCWPSHVAVGANGDVYVSYHGQPGFITVPGVSGGTPDGVSGLVPVLRSTDGGLTFPQRSEPFSKGEADTTWNAQSRPGAISDARFWTIGTGQGWILPDPDDPCTLHVVTTDDPDDDPRVGDSADVVMATSTDCGVTWTAPQTVNDGPVNTWQVLPTAAIDPITGAIAVTWLDNRDAASYPAGSAGNARADLRARYSASAGASWFPSVIINDVPLDPDASTSTIGSGIPATYRIGEYNGVAFSECTAHMVWAGQATCNGSMDTYYDRDPEVADLTEPIITCPADVVLGCNDSTDPDDTGRATARDLCDADPRVISVDNDLGGSCPPSPVIGNIQRIWSSTDAAGNFASCSQLISIQDFDAPVITAPPPLLLECSSPGGVPAADAQIQAWLAAAGANDDCSDADFGISGVPALFPVSCDGMPTYVTFSASDACGNSGFEVSPVSVVDTTAPDVLGDPGLQVLSPPDHEYQCIDGVRAAVGVADTCDSFPIDVLIECSSSQCDDAPCAEFPGQDGDGSTIDDCIYDPLLDRVCARAERADTNPEGRIYTVSLTATDSCGNANTETILELFVPLGCAEGDASCIFSDGVESANTAAWSNSQS